MAKILVVDDSLFMRRMLRSILINGGHDVIGEAENGQIALSRYTQLRPDLVTMDLTMPVLTGLEAVDAIIKKHPEARIVVCSAMGQQFYIVDALKAGAKDFIVKPFQADRVLEAIKKALS
jgi:two-component system chemotaxis response regulator CheY